MSEQPDKSSSPPEADSESIARPEPSTKELLSQANEQLSRATEAISKLIGENEEVSPETAPRVIGHAWSWSGPLPPPPVLAQYDQVVNKGSERVVSQWESESRHRRQLEERELRLAERSQIFATCLAIACALGAGALILAGHPAWGTALLVAEFLGLAGVFAANRRSK